jgi:predicted Zn-dependent protease
MLLLSAPGVGRAVSFQAERELGSQFALAARLQLPLVNDAELVGYVERIGRSIVRQLDDSFFDYHFFVVREPSLNAFAVPGGYIYVHTGLITRAANDDEIAGVLGHEIAHVHAHHLARQQEATQLMNYASLLGVLLSAVHPAIGSLATAASAAAQLRYRREFEQEADYLGARYMQAAGYDPHGMLDFFKKISDEQRLSSTLIPPYLLSHPLTDERLNNLEAVLRTQQWAATARRPASLALRRLQVVARARTEAPGDVVALYRQALAAQPGDPMARYLLGVACFETGQLETAQQLLEAARDQGIAAAERELGRVALRLRQPEQSRALLSRVLAREPQDPEALADLAKAHEALGEPETAADAYRRALAVAPDMEAAHHGLALISGRAGNEAEGFYHLATASYLGGSYERALSQYARAEELLPPADVRLATVRDRIKQLSGFLRVAAPPTPGGRRVPTPRHARG